MGREGQGRWWRVWVGRYPRLYEKMEALPPAWPQMGGGLGVCGGGSLSHGFVTAAKVFGAQQTACREDPCERHPDAIWGSGACTWWRTAVRWQRHLELIVAAMTALSPGPCMALSPEHNSPGSMWGIGWSPQMAAFSLFTRLSQTELWFGKRNVMSLNFMEFLTSDTWVCAYGDKTVLWHIEATTPVPQWSRGQRRF